MARSLTPRFRAGFGLTGLLLAALALVSQLALGSVAPARAAVQAAALTQITLLNQAMVTCRSGHTPARPHHAHIPPAPSSLCPARITLDLPGYVAPSGALPPPPAARRLPGMAIVAQARAPPTRFPARLPPRGPPTLA